MGHYLCPEEEKGCSVWDRVKVETCRAENLLYASLNIVQSGPIEKRKLPIYLPFIHILGEIP